MMIFREFETQADRLLSARRPAPVIGNKKSKFAE